METDVAEDDFPALLMPSPPATSLHSPRYVAPNHGTVKYSKYPVYWVDAVKSVPVVARNLGSDFLELILKYLQLKGVGVVRHCQ